MKEQGRFRLILRLTGLVKPLSGFIVLSAILGLFGFLCATLIPVLGSYALLECLNTHTARHLGGFFVTVVVLAALRGLFRYGESVCSHHIAFTGIALLRNQMFQILRRLCPAKLAGKDKGNLVSVITSDMELLETFYAHTLAPVISTALFSLLLSLFIGSFHPVLGILAFVAYAVVGLVIPVVASKLTGDIGVKIRGKSGTLSGYVLDSLRGLTETLQYGGSRDRLKEMNRQTEELLQDEKCLRSKGGRNLAITDGTMIFFEVSMLLIAAYLYKQGSVDFSGVLIPTIIMMSSFEPCMEIAALGSRLSKTFAAGKRVLGILDEVPGVADIQGEKELSFRGAHVDGVSFSISGHPVLQEASLKIPENAIVGITGPSGSGKSTLLKLLMRFWQADQGRVYISGTPIQHINTENLRNMESLVTQETHLFHDSIRNNLRIAKLDATQAEIEEACKKASVHDFIMSLPQGYDTPVGELGDRLSGGERQRIGLARAFLHGAPFLLLDEPTSNLDSLNEAVILRSLHNQRKDKTVVLVSHRNSTLRIAEKVYSVEQGKIR